MTVDSDDVESRPVVKDVGERRKYLRLNWESRDALQPGSDD
jgi:hypothetical protein